MTGLLDFTDSTVVITGAASGIGAAATELMIAAGAEVHAVDIAPVATAVAGAYTCDLGDQGSIDEVVPRLPAVMDALLNCAGVPNGGRFSAEAVIRINWLGLRHLTESLLPQIAPGGAVVNVASTAGRNWIDHAAEMEELMAADTFAAGLQWVAARGGDEGASPIGDGYALSKELVQYYTMWRALGLRDHGIRMNSICPGVTNTALVEDFRRGVGDDVVDRALAIAGRMAEPSEMAPALLFLADEASSSYINGLNLNIDSGTGAAHLLGRW